MAIPNTKATLISYCKRQLGYPVVEINVDEGLDGYLGVSYSKLVPLLIEAIKELEARITELEDT